MIILPKYELNKTYSKYLICGIESNHKGQFCYWVKTPTIFIQIDEDSFTELLT